MKTMASSLLWVVQDLHHQNRGMWYERCAFSSGVHASGSLGVGARETMLSSKDQEDRESLEPHMTCSIA